MDEVDRKILRVLQREGRITNHDLAARVSLSASACHRRVQRLEAGGAIAGYVALLDARALGRRATVFVEITLAGERDDQLERFERAVAQVPEVLHCHLMAGAADYLLMVVAEDSEDFARIHRDHLTRLPGVARMQSNFALRKVVETTALPV